MIQSKELRIGNVVYDTRTVGRSLALPPILTLARVKNTSEFYDFEYFEPVPITPEILVDNLGFKKWGRDDMPRTLSYQLGFFHIFPANSFCDFEGYGYLHYKLANFKNNKDESARFKFKHLHHLQNIYYLATNEELTFKP